MSELEAEWDPASQQVIFKPSNGAVHVSKNTDKNESVKRNQKMDKEKKNNFDWRNDENKVNSSRRPLSRGIASSSFHQSSEKQGQDVVRHIRSQSTKRIALNQTDQWRENEENKRQAFKSLTVYKTYPLQDQAVQHWRQLRQEWGVVNEDSEEIVTDTVAAKNLTCSDIGSSASSSSSRSIPEAKRCLRDREASPAESQQNRQFKKEFLSQRYINMTTTPNSFGPALYSLEPRLFAVEKQGRKMRYVCAHAGRFFDKYWGKTEPVNRHAYELIRPHTPCRLYFDIECDIEVNPFWKDDIDIRERFLNELAAELSCELQSQFGSAIMKSQCGERYRIQPLERKHIVDLDSSTDKKFSRHWIVHIPANNENITDSLITTEVLFPHSAAVGTFVKFWIGRLAEEQATGQLQSKRPTLHDHLFVRANSKAAIDSVRCVVDLGVYTRNRLFRIMGSTKSGKPLSAALRIAETNEFPFPAGFQNRSFYGPAMEENRYESQTQSQNDDEDVEHVVQKRVAKIDWARHAEALAQTLVVPLNGSKIDYPILPAADGDEIRSIIPVTRSLKSSSCYSSKAVSHGPSPYPMLDDFVITQLANRGGIQGMIRAWSIDYESTTAGSTPKPQVISYQMSQNRWCECVGRAHKSNNIAWHIDLRMFHCYQTCHDPDCRTANFRGTPVPLPEIVTAVLQDALFEEELARLDLSKVETRDESVNHVTIDEFNDFALDQALAALDVDDLITSRNLASQQESTSYHRDHIPKAHMQFGPRSQITQQINLLNSKPQLSTTNAITQSQVLCEDNESHGSQVVSFHASGLKDLPLKASEVDRTLIASVVEICRNDERDFSVSARYSLSNSRERNHPAFGLDAATDLDSNIDKGKPNEQSPSNGVHSSTHYKDDPQDGNILSIASQNAADKIDPPVSFGTLDADESEDEIDLVAIAREIERRRIQNISDE